MYYEYKMTFETDYTLGSALTYSADPHTQGLFAKQIPDTTDVRTGDAVTHSKNFSLSSPGLLIILHNI